MPASISHERHRWSYMTDRQLVTRLNRISGLEKLNNYIFIAREIGRDDLAEMGEERRDELFPTRSSDAFLSGLSESFNSQVGPGSYLSIPEKRSTGLKKSKLIDRLPRKVKMNGGIT